MSGSSHPQITAETVSLGENFTIGANSAIRGNAITIGDDVTIGDNVTITCDSLSMGDRSSIARGSAIMAPEIVYGQRARTGSDFAATLNQYFRMGKFSAIGSRVVLSGQGFECGEFLWMKNDIILGGGGSQGPNAYLTIGDRTTIIDRSYINLSERVDIGSDTAFSMNVVVLTHGAWQPALEGYGSSFGSVSIGNKCVIYLNSVIMPGVTVGSGVTIGANATVTKDLPDSVLAVGSPARIVKSEGYPRPRTSDQKHDFLASLLVDYFTTVEVKDVTVVAPFSPEAQFGKLEFQGQRTTIALLRGAASPEREGFFVTIGEGPHAGADVHFDITAMEVTGAGNPVSEDLRDYLRRRAVKFFNGTVFSSLPLANIKRLKALRDRN